ncbi:MAG: DUF5107 domain-containing protein [Planctomycetes bacterium]|nr:DUF5107 domain-containing protein [Planctomycetota bacterium]
MREKESAVIARGLARNVMLAAVSTGLSLTVSPPSRAQPRAWEGTLTIPTYEWEADVNPRFWALAHGSKGAIVYPYTMQDHLSRTRVDRTYRALFLENEYLKVTCLPELGGRIHSVLDKTENKQMFYLNRVIKPSMIAMRGAWISGGIEWNAGPQGHTVSCVSPVDALVGMNPDGSAYIEVSNLEQSQRTRWTARVTLHPGKAYLDERIRLFNPTDALSPYYFWNCTAFPNRPGTRFVFPMTLGTDHAGTKFFSWPINEGKDLTWLKNYDTWASIFAVQCTFDFFGAYDVDLDRGIVQVADHTELGGKKAWTWGTWDYGVVSQKNLTDEDGPYIEVQSGPLPTQSDYGALWPRDEVAWQEWWYPVHGLGDGFEFATRDVAVQTVREDDQLQLRILSTSVVPGVTCAVSNEQGESFAERLDLSPNEPRVVTLSPAPQMPVDLSITTAEGVLLASFVSPLPIPRITPPEQSMAREEPIDSLPVEQRYLKGRKADLATDRVKAREHYEQALAVDPEHVATLRALAVLELEAGRHEEAVARLAQALSRDPSDGLSWYFRGIGHLRLGDFQDALRCGNRAAHCRETVSLGHDLTGRAHMRLKQYSKAVDAFSEAARRNPADTKAQNHLLLALYASRDVAAAQAQARSYVAERPTDLIPRAILALEDTSAMRQFVRDVHRFVGDIDFEMIETSLVFAEVGLASEAARLLSAVCVESVRPEDRASLPLYYLAWLAGLQGDHQSARANVAEANRLYRDFEFASRSEAIEVLKCAVETQPRAGGAHFQLGNVYGHLGRLDEAVLHWQTAVELDPSLSVAFRNLARYSQVVEQDPTKAAELYRKAIDGQPTDQTLYRDLAKVLAADGKPGAAIELLASVPPEPPRRADLLLTLAGLYVDTERFTHAIELLESTPHFINWEGGNRPWLLFSRAHIGRGRQHLQSDDFEAALQDFEAALTYPENLGVGRSNEHEHAAAHYWRGQALAALGRHDEARSAWQEGAAQHEGSEEQKEHRAMCRAALASDQ